MTPISLSNLRDDNSLEERSKHHEMSNQHNTSTQEKQYNNHIKNEDDKEESCVGWLYF